MLNKYEFFPYNLDPTSNYNQNDSRYLAGVSEGDCPPDEDITRRQPRTVPRPSLGGLGTKTLEACWALLKPLYALGHRILIDRDLCSIYFHFLNGLCIFNVGHRSLSPEASTKNV